MSAFGLVFPSVTLARLTDPWSWRRQPTSRIGTDC